MSHNSKQVDAPQCRPGRNAQHQIALDLCTGCRTEFFLGNGGAGKIRGFDIWVSHTQWLFLSLPACGERAGERGLVKDRGTSSPQPSAPPRRGDWSLEIFRQAWRQSRRDCINQPRVARNELPWEEVTGLRTTLKGLNRRTGLRILAPWHNHWRRFWYMLCSPPRIAVHFCATKLYAKNCTDTLAEFCPISNASP